MSENINPLAPAEDAVQEEAAPATEEVSSDENAPAVGAEEATPLQIPAWAVMPDGGRTGLAPVAEEAVEESVSEAEEPEAAEYDGARAHNQVEVRINQGT